MPNDAFCVDYVTNVFFVGLHRAYEGFPLSVIVCKACAYMAFTCSVIVRPTSFAMFFSKTFFLDNKKLDNRIFRSGGRCYKYAKNGMFFFKKYQ